jgi:hypothetical protein
LQLRQSQTYDAHTAVPVYKLQITSRNVTRLSTALIGLPVIALLGLGVVATQAQASSAGATSVQTVSPLDATGELKPSYQVTRRLDHGTCQTGSYQVGQAYRCTTPESAADVLDPCWPLAASPTTVVCQEKPWVHKVVELRVTGGASGGPGFHAVALPWGMRIGANVRCLRDVGSVFRIDGHGLLYHCTRHRDVFGPLHDSGTSWTAHVYSNDARTHSGYQSRGRQHVAIAWRGAPAGSASPSPSPTSTATSAPTATASPLT